VVVSLKTKKYPEGIELDVSRSGKVRTTSARGSWLEPTKPEVRQKGIKREKAKIR
jgi:hypothetical protein